MIYLILMKFCTIEGLVRVTVRLHKAGVILEYSLRLHRIVMLSRVLYILA